MNKQKTCTKCKENKILDDFGKISKKDRLIYICKKCMKEYKQRYNLEYNKKNLKIQRERWLNYYKEDRGRYNSLKNQAKRKNLELGITAEQYLNLMEEKICYYCNGSINSTGSGLDRIDSSRGYTLENVVKCCKKCNQMKNDLSQSEFFEHLNSIYVKHVHDKRDLYE